MDIKTNSKFFTSILMTITILFNMAVMFTKCEGISISIPIVMATDDNYLMPTLVSIVSASENANYDIRLKFYIMVPGEFSSESRSKIHKLNDQLSNCEISILEMEDDFKEYEKGHWATAAYYRLKIATVLKNESKCIYLDGDTLVLRDLAEMYKVDISNYYVAGVPDEYRLHEEHASKLGIKNMNQYICSGSLVWNLDKVREDCIEEKFQQFLKKTLHENKSLMFLDQDVINAVCYGKIKDLSFKYGALVGLMYCSEYEEDPCLCRLIDKKEWEEGMHSTVVLHFMGEKPWKSNSVKFCDLWYKYYFDLMKISS